LTYCFRKARRLKNQRRRASRTKLTIWRCLLESRRWSEGSCKDANTK